MLKYATWTAEDSPVEIPEGIRIRWEFDEMHETRGSYGYDSDQENEQAENHEIAKLDSGEWVVLGYIMETDDGEHLDSCWGIVIENSESALVTWFDHSIEPCIPSEVSLAKLQMAKAIESVDVAHTALVRAHERLQAA